jgi:hypothetical protein
MHETPSPIYKGNVDKIDSADGYVTVTGWAAGIDAYTENNIVVFNPTTSMDIPCEVTLVQRPDVYSYYNQSSPLYLNCGLKVKFAAQVDNCFVLIKGEPVLTVPGNKFAGKNLDDIIKLNPRARRELIIVDNFYDNPDQVREYALAQEFKANELYHKGSRTQRSYIPGWAKDEFSRLLGKPVTEFVGATGVFQYCVAKDNVVYHYDTQEYAAMVYLSPDAPLQTGTQTFRSKLTGLFGAATDEDAVRLGKTKEEIDTLSFNGNNFYDRHNMELVDSAANIYNRCVIFNARALHAATSYYGSNKENSRLFHLYFFNC